MILGEVLGRVWSERQHAGLDGRRLVLVREHESGSRYVAVDLLDAGAGSTVLLATDEAAAAATGVPSVDAAVVALVSGWDGGTDVSELASSSSDAAAWIVPLTDPGAADVALVGGKGAGLHRLAALGAQVPAGFVVSTTAFGAAVTDQDAIEAAVRALPPDASVEEAEQAADAAREQLAAADAGPVLDAVRAAYRELGEGFVAVRSSAAAEDAADASYAGEHDSYLDVEGADAVADAVRRCWASLYTARAVAYRRGRPAGAMAVVVQRMVAARAAGVFMTLNPANGDRSTFVCEAVWGLGEPLVSGEVTPDRFAVDKITGDVVRREIAHKPSRLARGGPQDVPDAERDAPCLTDAELAELLRIGRAVEKAAGTPQDGEFAVDDDGVHLLQARPETVWSRRNRSVARGRTALDAVLATLTSPGGPDGA